MSDAKRSAGGGGWRGPARALALLLGAAALAAGAPPSTPAPQASPTPPPLRLRLNIPAFELEVWEQGAPPRTVRVAVGMPRYPTRPGSFAVSRAVWNPWWQPPPSDWARGEPLTPPGPRNPMGRVKLFYDELYFLHGTPSVHSLGSAASHGCVRMANEDAIALARLVHLHGSPEVPPTLLDALEAAPSRTRAIPLSRPVPIEIVYELAAVQAGALRLYPDPYGWGRDAARAHAVAALTAAGVPLDLESRAALEALLAEHQKEAREVPLAELFVEPPGPPETGPAVPAPPAGAEVAPPDAAGSVSPPPPPPAPAPPRPAATPAPPWRGP